MEYIEDKINHFIKMHYDLHGSKFNWDDCWKDFKNNIDFNPQYIMEINDKFIENIQKFINSKKEYGLFLGRCMPFTNGHNETIQEIIRDGKIPIMMLGGVGKNDERHPLSFDERVKLIKQIYPIQGIKFIPLKDQESWDEWYKNVKAGLFDVNIEKEQITLYAHNKEIDRKDFVFNSRHYIKEFYTKLFELDGIKIKNMNEKTCSLGLTIHASDVRKDEEVAKRNLDARIYRYLKVKKQWWA